MAGVLLDRVVSGFTRQVKSSMKCTVVLVHDSHCNRSEILQIWQVEKKNTDHGRETCVSLVQGCDPVWTATRAKAGVALSRLAAFIKRKPLAGEERRRGLERLRLLDGNKEEPRRNAL